MATDYASNGQAWSVALRRLMGYPLYAPACHTIGWSASAPRDLVGIMEMAQIAADMNRDLVHLSFAGEGLGAPIDISLAIRRDKEVEWLSGCRLYAASETARLEILAGEERWRVGARQVLVSAKRPPRKRIAKGEALAMDRWHRAFEQAANIELVGTVCVPRGGRFADAIPQEAFGFAAAA